MMIKLSAGDEDARLICLPYAGGSAQIYRRWPTALGPSVGVYAVELPGRGRRPKAPLHRTMDDAVAELLPLVASLADKPLSLFGHSLGGALAFELAYAGWVDLGIVPRVLIISGIAPVSVPPVVTCAPTQADSVEGLELLGLSHGDFASQPGLLKFLLPILRADLRLLRSWKPMSPQGPLPCPIVALSGSGDRLATTEQMALWSGFTVASFQRLQLPGGHLFMTESHHQLLATVAEYL